MSDSELRAGSPRRCRLRTDRLAPLSKFNYVLKHTTFMGFCKLSSFDGHRVKWSLTSPAMMYIGIVYGHPRIPQRMVSCERRALGKGVTQPDSLIVVVNYGHSWCLCGSRVSYCQIITLQDLNWFESLWHPRIWRIWVTLARCSHSVEVSFHLCSYEIYGFI
jgi:hypothetical protein